MSGQSRLNQLITYKSFEEIYNHKQGVSDLNDALFWMQSIPKWKFYFAHTRDSVPIDFFATEFDDSSWQSIDVPSVWQQKGYGYPTHLLYDEMHPKPKRKGLLKKKIDRIISIEKDDPVGIYRAQVNMPTHFLKRVVYFLSEGINGRFELYINGHLVCQSNAVFSTQKFLLSEYIKAGNNQVTLLIFRMNKVGALIEEEKGTFGFSGIFRLPFLIAEPLITISDLKLSCGFQGNVDFSSEIQVFNQAYQMDTDCLQSARLMIDLSFLSFLKSDYSIQLDYKIIRVQDEYDIYNLPEVRVKRSKNTPILVSAKEKGLSQSNEELIVYSIMPWTDVTPVLYDLIIEIKDLQGRKIDVKKVRFGFRTVKIVDSKICINDTTVPLHAVRYYCFDPVGGLTLSKEIVEKDIQLMKQAQINCVIIPYFPPSTYFLSMCDRAGIYVICGEHYSRLAKTIQSLSLHPSIIMWHPSYFEDEHARVHNEKNIWKMHDSRPIYVSEENNRISDIPTFPSESGVVYGYWQDICLDRQARAKYLRPDERLFESIIGRPEKKDDHYAYQFIHQGDLEEYHEHRDVAVSQGIVSADRKPHPIYFEIKRQCERLKIFADPNHPEKLTIYNTYPFGQTGPMRLEWSLHIGGQKLRGGSGLFPSLVAFEHRKIRFPFSLFDYTQYSKQTADPLFLELLDKAYIKELVLNVRVLSGESTAYVSVGEELLFYQETIINDLTEVSTGSETSLSKGDKSLFIFGQSQLYPVVTATPIQIAVSSRVWNTSISFSRKMGALESVRIGNAEFLADDLLPSFYRSATNMDRSDQSYILSSTVFSKETNWRSIQSEMVFKKMSYEFDGDDFTLLSVYSTSGMKQEVVVYYRVHPSGRVEATLSFAPEYEPVRYGFRFKAPLSADKISWYGLGPGESYPDRKASAKIGFYTKNSKDMFHLYARPSESGARCKTQLLILEDKNGSKLKITRKNNKEFSFTAIPYAPEDVDDSMHAENIVAQNEYNVFLDFYHKDIERTEKPPKTIRKENYSPDTFVFEPLLEE